MVLPYINMNLLISVWIREFLFYSIAYYILIILFILMLKLSQIWPVEAPLRSLLCHFDMCLFNPVSPMAPHSSTVARKIYPPSGSSQCTSPKHPVPCIEPGLATHFIHDIIHVSMLFSQISPPSPSPTESI